MPFRIFFVFLQSAGMPSVPILVQGISPLIVWLALTLFFPGISEAETFSWSVFGFMTTVIWLQIPSGMKRAERNRVNARGVAVHIFALWATIAVLIFWAAEPIWLQRIISAINALYAVLLLYAILSGDECIGKVCWSLEDFETGRPNLIRAFFLFHVTILLLNETLIANISLNAWLIWLALLPLTNYYISIALTITVFLDLEPPD